MGFNQGFIELEYPKSFFITEPFQPRSYSKVNKLKVV